jgi:hypothetical protein
MRKFSNFYLTIIFIFRFNFDKIYILNTTMSRYRGGPPTTLYVRNISDRVR